MQTLECVWENEKVCVNKLSRSLKLPLVFATLCVSTARVI